MCPGRPLGRWAALTGVVGAHGNLWRLRSIGMSVAPESSTYSKGKKDKDGSSSELKVTLGASGAWGMSRPNQALTQKKDWYRLSRFLGRGGGDSPTRSFDSQPQ